MRAMITIWAVLCVAIQVVPSAVRAQSQDSVEDRTWAVGWDDGIGMRHELSRTWGLGMRLRPTFSDVSTDENTTVITDTSRTDSTRPAYTSEDRALELSAMLYRKFRVSRRVGLGPYVGIGCRYARDVNITEPYYYDEVRQSNRSERTEKVVSLEIGLRPTFTFLERLVLETRVGLTLLYTDTDWESSRSRDSQVEVDHTSVTSQK